MQQQRAFFYCYFVLLSNGSKLTKGVADVVVARTKNCLIRAIEEAKELVLRGIKVAADHFDLAAYAKSGLEFRFPSSDGFDWFDVCVH
jgi:hypothetical protein